MRKGLKICDTLKIRGLATLPVKLNEICNLPKTLLAEEVNPLLTAFAGLPKEFTLPDPKIELGLASAPPKLNAGLFSVLPKLGAAAAPKVFGAGAVAPKVEAPDPKPLVEGAPNTPAVVVAAPPKAASVLLAPKLKTGVDDAVWALNILAP